VLLAAVVLASTGWAEAQTQAPTLKVAVVVRADSPPLLETDGEAARDAGTAIADADRAFRALGQLRVPFAVSASPLWVDELIVAGQTSVYSSLVALATRHPLLAGPYAHVLLPDEGGPGAVLAELGRGRAEAERSLQTASQPILDPPGLALSWPVLETARDAGVIATLARADEVGGEPVAQRGITIVPAEELADANAVPSLVDRHGPADRIAVIVRPTDGLGDVIGALAGDKRISLVNITDVVAHPGPGSVQFAPVPAPPSSYGQAVAGADAAAANFASYTLPGNPLTKVMGVLLARARSTADWRSDWQRGVARADAVTDLAAAQRAFFAVSNGSVTLTARRGAVPVTLVSRARYPVRLRVGVTSPKLTFPRGNTKIVTISPHGLTVTFVAEARSTGAFPMDVFLESPNGRVRFAGGRVVVRSTAANILALVLTLSGLLFLVGWSSRGFIRTRVRRTRR